MDGKRNNSSKNLIKLTKSSGGEEIMKFICKLPNKDKIRKKEYRHFGFDEKREMANFLGKMFNEESKKLAEKIKSSGIEPCEKWQVNQDYLPALTLLQCYFIFVKAYVESLVGFITLYLQDLSQRGVNVGIVETKNKYENLKKFDVDVDDLKKLNEIRSLCIHSKKEGEFAFAFYKNKNGNLDPCLIALEYNADIPSEKNIYHYSNLTKINATASSIANKFYDYVNNLLNKSWK